MKITILCFIFIISKKVYIYIYKCHIVTMVVGWCTKVKVKWNYALEEIDQRITLNLYSEIYILF